MRFVSWHVAAIVATFLPASAMGGQYFTVTYPASKQPGGLQMGVTYTIWIPEGAKRLRGIIVHQHGCGVGACKGGETAAYDLHWQALAEKWRCALLGPSYHQGAKQNCRLWCDPRNGSAKTFLRSLSDLAEKSKHPELTEVPWCLWGHSGGAFWASLMQTLYPERIVAIWLRSGTAYYAWQDKQIPMPKFTPAVFEIPVMCNPGAKEKDHKRFRVAWNGAVAMFREYRAKGSPISFAADPRTGHECGDSRYLAIPFFDVCLAMRLPNEGNRLHPVDWRQAYLATFGTTKAVPAKHYRGDKSQAIWLPNEKFARMWREYLLTGAVSDTTPPPAPYAVVANKTDQGVKLRWTAKADFESGIRAFLVLRNGKVIGQVPEKPRGRFGRPLFQAMSYHDTPEQPLPEMRFTDRQPKGHAEYQIVTVNSVGLRSRPSEAVTVRRKRKRPEQ